MARRIIELDEVEAGCELARPVTKNGDILFLSGRTLSERDIRALKRWDVRTVTVKKKSLREDQDTLREAG